jgi:hypothetical protein
MSESPNFSLPYIDASQAQPAVTHNEALRAIDALLQLAVLDRDLTSPPATPANGERWIVADGASDDWEGHDGEIAAWLDGAWRFFAPHVGWFAYVADDSALLAWDGDAWVSALEVLSGLTELQNLMSLGIGTTADATNPFTAKLNSALWVAKTDAEGGDGNLRCKMSKESEGDTLSLLFQDGFSSRAEIGLTGDDDLHIKVSADGSGWLDALTIDKSTGKVTFDQGLTEPFASFDALAANVLSINGGVEVSQELGTAGATLSNNTAKYTADQWEAMYNHGAATAVVTSGQVAASSFPSALAGFLFGHQIKATTAISAIANGDFAYHRQKIKGHRIAKLGWGAAGAQSITVAFQFYSTAAGTAFIRVSNAAGNRAYHREFAVASGWNFICETIPGDTSGAWLTTGSAAMIVAIFNAGKAASPAAPNTWGATPAIQTTNSSNLLGSNNNLTIVTGFAVLPAGQKPTQSQLPLLMLPFEQALEACQEYYEKSYAYGVAPGTASALAGIETKVVPSNTIANQQIYGGTRYTKPKRGTPTVTIYGLAGGAGKISNFSGSDLADLSGTPIAGELSFYAYNNSGGSISTTTNIVFYHWVADARL